MIKQLFIALCFLLMVGISQHAHALNVTLGKAEIIKLRGNVSDILVADPNVVDVRAVQNDRIYVVGLKIGDTNVMVLDANGKTLRRLDIHVSYDLYAVRKLVSDLFPAEDINISSIHDKIVLTGAASTPEIAARASDVVASYVASLQDVKGSTDDLISNMLHVEGEQQVMLQVKIIEATRTVLKELGLQTSLNGGSSPSSAGDFTGVFTTGAGIALGSSPAGVANLLYNTGINGLGSIQTVINALEEESLVNVLAEPNLTAVSGQKAGFLAGGEFPVPVGLDNIGNVVIEFREFGVSLNFRPVVMSDKRINLQLNTEVSSLDFDNAVTLSGLQVPGLDVRRADTTVELPSGGSLMIAGLLQSQAVEGMSGLPGISKTPILGDLASSDRFKREETELVVIVTGYLVSPYADKNKAELVAQKQSENALSRNFKNAVRHRLSKLDQDTLNNMGAAGYVLN